VTSNEYSSAVPTPCSLLRRLGAIVYDALLLLAVLFIATIPLLIINRGHSIAAADPVYQGYLLLVSFLFYGWFWTHGGQTLGMRAWRIRLQTPDGRAVTWLQALLRFLAAIVSWAALGLGFLWSLVDKQRRTWHDRFSESVLVVLPKRK
jgi:uncharacterized RDD family membrane protein YckC